MLRLFVLLAGLLAVAPAFAAESMSPDEARKFVVGKTFSYNCFEGTRGQGRILSDGSVVGSIQFQGAGKVRYAALPANTVQVKGGSVCASLRGMPIDPCFNITKVDEQTFRGAISGLGFAYCEFTRRTVRASASTNDSGQPLGLRPSLEASNKN